VALRILQGYEKIDLGSFPRKACAGAPAPPRWNACSARVFGGRFRLLMPDHHRSVLRSSGGLFLDLRLPSRLPNRDAPERAEQDGENEDEPEKLALVLSPSPSFRFRGAYSLHSERCERVILSTALFLIIFAPLAYGAVEPWARNIVLFCIGSMTCAWLWRCVSSGRPRLSLPPFFPAAILFLVLIAMQLVPLPGAVRDLLTPARVPRATASAGATSWERLTANPGKTATGGMFLAACLTFCFVLLNSFRHRRWIKLTLTVLLTLGGFEAFYGLLEYWTGHQHIFWYQKIYYLEEVTGTYINHNHFAGLLGPLLLLGVGAFVVRFTRFVAGRSYTFAEDGRSVWKKVTATAQLIQHLPASLALLLSVIGLMAVALILSQSRGALVSCAAALGLQVFLLWKLRSRSTESLQALGLLALLAILLGVALAPRVLTRFSYAPRDAPERFELWQDSARIVRDYPWLGTGLGTYRDVLPRYRPQKDFFFVAGIPQPATINYAHNDYLQLLTECGFVGFGLMAWALVATLRNLFSKFANHADWETAAMGSSLTAGMVAFLLHSLVDFGMHIPANALMFCQLLSVALVLVQNVETDSATADRG
jgi:O-antigen ligase